MKYPIFVALLLLAVLNVACTGTRSNTHSNANTPTGITETGPVATVDNTLHYVVNMQFTKDQARPESGVREAGEATLLVIPSSEMFLAIYEGGQLAYYYDFPDPLRARGSGGAGGVQTTATGAVWFPAWMADKNRAARADVGIYAVISYTDAFANQVQNGVALKNAVSKGVFRKAYTLDGTNMASFLSGIK